MSEVWKNILKEWVECYHSIKTIEKAGFTDEEETGDLKIRLLHEIIATCESELSEDDTEEEIPFPDVSVCTGCANKSASMCGECHDMSNYKLK